MMVVDMRLGMARKAVAIGTRKANEQSCPPPHENGDSMPGKKLSEFQKHLDNRSQSLPKHVFADWQFNWVQDKKVAKK
jgi:hypothetical protein